MPTPALHEPSTPVPPAGSRLALAFLVATAVALPPAAGAAAWRPEGPDTGNVRDVAFDPHRPGTVWAATANGGVWRSGDGGRSWTLPGTGMMGRKIEWLEPDPGTAGTLWAGIDSPGRPSLFRSRDDGATWERVTDRYPGVLGTLQPTGARIAFAPSRPAEIWVPSTNLHYRSRDGGKTWSDFRVPGQDAYVFAVDPADPQVVYAGGRGDTHHLSRSDDGGASWTPVGEGLDGTLRLLVVDPSAPQVVWTVVGFNQLHRSADRGATFARVAIPADGTDEIWKLAIDPSDSRRLWAATESGLFRSADGGATWQRSDRGTGRYWVRAVAVDPAAPGTLVAATSGGGLYRSEDGGASWRPSSAGLGAGWVERLYGAPGSDLLFARAGTGLFRRDAEGVWAEIAAPFVEAGERATPDGMSIDAGTGAVFGWQHSRAWRSRDGGRSWEELKGKELSARDVLRNRLEGVQFRSLAPDPADPQRLWAGARSNSEPGNAVFRSRDGGRSWEPAGRGLPGGEEVTLLRAVAPQTLLVLVDDAGLFRSADGGDSWTKVGSGLPGLAVREIAADPNEPARLFAAFEQGLFRSADGGATWTRVEGALAQEDVEAVAVAPDGKVYAGSFGGVFRSTDAGATFTPIGDGLPVSDVRALAVAGSPPRLWAGLAGGSVWSTALE